MNAALATRMMGRHDELDATFHAHQRALLDRDFARAAALLAAYRQSLLLHMADEEQLMLPRYQQLGGDATDAPTKLFLGEHARMREFVADFVTRVDALAGDLEDRRLLALFDRQATYKNLLLHHDLRERNALYPFLAARLGVAEQHQLLAAVRW